MTAEGQEKGSVRLMTASEAGLSRQKKILIILRKILASGGVLQMPDICRAVEEQMSGAKLSYQGEASLRELVNRYAVKKGYVFKHDPKNPGWRITPEGRRLVEEYAATYPAEHPSSSPVDVETFEGADEDIDLLIQEHRLRIGCIDTGDELALSRRRRGQQRLRELTLSNYSSTCAFCDVNTPSLLVASHIVGWAEDPEARGILSNIICLCRFHDVLFEQGYLSLTDDLTVLRRPGQTSRTIATLLDNTVKFRKPRNYSPEPEFLCRHRLRFGLYK